jgi:hypothetical protein
LSIERGLAGDGMQKILSKKPFVFVFSVWGEGWDYNLEAMTLKLGEKVGTRPFPITKAFQGFFFFVFESAPPYTQVSFNS